MNNEFAIWIKMIRLVKNLLVTGSLFFFLPFFERTNANAKMKSMNIRLNAVMQYVVVGLVVIIIVKDGISQKKEKEAQPFGLWLH